MLLVASRRAAAPERVLLKDSSKVTDEAKTPEFAQIRRWLEYEAAEENRSNFEVWDTIQLGFGLGLFLFFLFGTKEGKWLIAVVLWMEVLVLIERFYLTPEITALGRLTDFLPPEAGSTERARLWVLQNAYYGAEGLKWVAGLGLAGQMIFFRSRSGHTREKVDVIDKADYRHIDR